MPVVSAVVAGGHSSAFLTSAPDEFPEPRGSQLLDRYLTPRTRSTVPTALSCTDPCSKCLKATFKQACECPCLPYDSCAG